MSDSIPANWVETTIGSACEPVSKRGPDPASPSFRYIDLSSIDRSAKEIASTAVVKTRSAPSRAKQVVQKGDVLFSNVRVYLENIAQVPEELDGEIASTAFCVLRPATGIHPRYLYHFVTSRKFVQEVDELQRGNSPPSVQDSDVRAQPFWIAPAGEQRRIVSRIDELFSRIEEGEQALKSAEKLVERYRQSVLKAAVTGELTRDWREARTHAGEPVESGEALLARILKSRRAAWEAAELAKLKAKGKAPTDDRWKKKYKEPQPHDTTDLPGLPEGWAWASLPMLSSDDTCNGISVKGSDDPPGTPALRLDAMTENGFDYSARRYIKIEEGKAQRLAIVEGDFFVSRANGSRALVGRAVSAQPPPERIVFPDTMIRYRPLRDLVSESWLVATWASTFVRNQIERRAKTTAGIYKVSQEDITGIAIPVCSLTEQREIVTRAWEAIESITRVSITCAAERKRSSGLRQSILKTAFSGQLVPQDPDDEPASKLLERIAAERTETVPAIRKRKKKVA